MWIIIGSWVGSAIVFLGLAVLLGRRYTSGGWFGILLDSRGRYSLTHFQLLLWSVVILSLIAGVFFGRWIHGASDPLNFTVPGPVLGLLGISVGSAAAATAVKTSKDVTAAARIAASGDPDPPRLGQIFVLEEGQYADQVIDITKYQNFIFTLVLVVAYVVLSIHAIVKAGGALGSLPTFSGTFLILVGISQAGYVANKLPSQTGSPAGLTVANRTTPGAVFMPRNLQGLTPADRDARRHAVIAQRALEISRSSGAGDASSNWSQAESEVG